MNIKDVLKHELIGKNIEIVNAENTSLIGIKGTIIDETKNLLVIQQKDKTKKLIKKQITIQLIYNNHKIQIKGKDLVKRPEERIK